MSNLKLNTESGSVTLVPENGSGNVDVTIPRAGVGKVLQSKSVKSTSLVTISSSSLQEVISLDFTKKSSTSVLHIEFNAHWGSGDNVIQTKRLEAYINADSVALEQNNFMIFNESYSESAPTYKANLIHYKYVYETSNMNTINFSVTARDHSGFPIVMFGREYGSYMPGHFIITEIAN